MTNFTVEDDFTDPTHIDANDGTDNLAVYSVTLNKDYDGVFYIYESTVERFGTGNCVGTAAQQLKTAGSTNTNGAAATAYNVVTTAAANTAKYAIDEIGDANVYTAPDGKVTYKWVCFAGNEPTRGKSYKLVFDQDGITEDDITATTRTDVTATEASECAYLPAPASMEIQTVAKNQAAVVKFLDADGEVLSYLGKNTALANAGFSSIVVKGNSSASETGAVVRVASGGNFTGGVYTSTATIGTTSDFYYAEAKTSAGVFAEKAATIKSGFKAGNAAGASKADISQDASDISQANIAVAGVIADATIYVVDKTKNGTTAFDPNDSTTYLKSAELKAASSEIKIAGIFSEANKAHEYYAVIVPNDEKLYARFTGGTFTPISKATSLQVNSGTITTQASGLTSANWNSVAMANNATLTLACGDEIQVLDQYGSVTTSTDSNIAETALTVTTVNGGGVVEAGATGKYKVVAGVLTAELKFPTATPIDINDGYKFTILGTEFSIISKGELGVATNAFVKKASTALNTFTADGAFEVKAGSTTIIAADLDEAKVTTLYNLQQAIGNSSATGLATIATYTAALGQNDKSLTIPAGVAVTLGATFTNAATLNVNGTLQTSDVLTNSGTINVTGTLETTGAADNLVQTGTSNKINLYKGATVTLKAENATVANVFTVCATGVGDVVTIDDTTNGSSDFTVAATSTDDNGVLGANDMTVEAGGVITLTATNDGAYTYDAP